jgi:hypothetical protein
MSILRLLASVTIVSFALPALAANAHATHPRTITARNTTPNAHHHTLHPHVRSQRPHHTS